MRIVNVKRFLIIAILSCLFTTAKAQGYPNLDSSLHKFTVDELVSDYTYFRALLEKAHPSLYRYTTKDSMDHYFVEALSKLDHPMNQIQFWQILQGDLIDKIKCGHTVINPSQSYSDKYGRIEHPLLPFFIYIKDDRIFVKEYLGKKDSTINLDDEVLAINNETAQQLLQELRPLVSGDGYSNAFKNFQLETGRFNAFYWRLHSTENSFTILFRSPDGTTTKKVIQPLIVNVKGDSSYHQNSDGQDAKGIMPPNDSLHTVSYPSDIPQTAWVKIKSFMYSDALDFDTRLFKELEKNNIQNLVIDLRNNTGGMNSGPLDLLKYLLPKNFYYIKEQYTVVDTSEFKALCYVKSSSSVDPMTILPMIQHQVYTLNYPAVGLQNPYKRTFKGKVYVLINDGTFSAGSLFATALKEQSDCKLYGQETGGNRGGCDAGTLRYIIMPRTFLRLYIPFYWVSSASTAANTVGGLKPDVEVPVSSKDMFYPMIKAAINGEIGK